MNGGDRYIVEEHPLLIVVAGVLLLDAPQSQPTEPQESP
jgi:hypothetical protein